MKITVDVDCTPEEARRFMGLPDLSSVHDAYVAKMRQTIDDSLTPEGMTSLLQNWGPMGEASMGMWKQLFEQMSGRSGK